MQYLRVPVLCGAINEAAVTELAELQASSLKGIGPVMGPGDRIITMWAHETRSWQAARQSV
jgi:hypothetical protein